MSYSWRHNGWRVDARWPAGMPKDWRNVMPLKWHWQKKTVPAQEIIDSAATMRVCSQLLTMDFTLRWVDARRYLSWAFDALQRGGEDGWDSAAGWAERAVCRQMDGLLVQNHLRCFLGKNYKD